MSCYVLMTIVRPRKAAQSPTKCVTCCTTPVSGSCCAINMMNLRDLHPAGPAQARTAVTGAQPTRRCCQLPGSRCEAVTGQCQNIVVDRGSMQSDASFDRPSCQGPTPDASPDHSKFSKCSLSDTACTGAARSDNSAGRIESLGAVS